MCLYILFYIIHRLVLAFVSYALILFVCTLTYTRYYIYTIYRNAATPRLPANYSSPKMWSIIGIWPVIIQVYKAHNSEGYDL